VRLCKRYPPLKARRIHITSSLNFLSGMDNFNIVSRAFCALLPHREGRRARVRPPGNGRSRRIMIWSPGARQSGNGLEDLCAR
jgi:hypothetical protein